MSNLLKIIEDSTSKVCLSTPELIRMIKTGLFTNRDISLPENFRWITVDKSKLKKPDPSFSPAIPDEDAVIMLQYSSGSTGTPKGVMLSHKNIVQNTLKITKAFNATQASVGLSFLPMYHDMGLIGHFFTPIMNNGYSLLMSPITFLKNPLLFLQLISKHRVQVAGAPNFAYGILATKSAPPDDVTLDLSCWKIAYCGAEPVRPSTVRQFFNTYKRHGFDPKNFYPVYGMAEATLLISCRDSLELSEPNILKLKRESVYRRDKQSFVEVVDDVSERDDSQVQEVISLGKVDENTTLLVVDPETREPCKENQIGEFWVSSACVSAGYWRKDAQSKDTFKATLEDTTASNQHFLRTGDLGFLRNSELYFISRLKEVIIIDGANYWPHDIEETVEVSHPLLRKHCSAVFSIERNNREVLCVCIEIKRGIFLSDEEEISVKKSIQKSIFEHHSLSVELNDVVLLEGGAIPKTTSGKVQRFQCKNMLLLGTLRLAKKKNSMNFLRKISDSVIGWLAAIWFYVVYVCTLMGDLKSKISSKSTLNKKKNQSGNGVTFSEKKKDNIPGKKVEKIPGKVSKETVELQQKIANIICKQMDIREIDFNTPLYEYGMRSIDAVAICGEIETLYQGTKKVPPTSFYEHYTVQKLTNFLLSDESNVEKFQEEAEEPLENFRSFSGNRLGTVPTNSYVLGIGTAVPKDCFSQKDILENLITGSAVRDATALIPKVKRVFESCSVRQRHLVLCLEDILKLEGTGQRNELYEKFAPELATKAALEAIKNWGGDRSSITHVISVSCTGTIVPGLEFHLVNALQLNRSVNRLSVNFMGCFGALAAIRTAQNIALADPSHRVLIVCTELCSLHAQSDVTRFDNLIGEAIFGDGAAALIVGGSKLSENENCLFEILTTNCYAISNSTEKLQWNLSDSGWRIGLSPDIPFVFQKALPNFCKSLMGNINGSECLWAIHPGGKAIVQIVEKSFDLCEEQTSATWKVLAEYGNMSSGTVIFILNEMCKKGNFGGYGHVVSLAFGPGLAVEGLLLKIVPPKSNSQ